MAASRSVLAVLIAVALPAVAQEAPKADSAFAPGGSVPAVKSNEHGGASVPGEPPKPGPAAPSQPEPPRERPDGPWKPGEGPPPWGHRGPPPVPFDKEKLPPHAEADRDRAQRELQRLTPEQRQRVWKAVLAVMNLPEDKRDSLINSEEERRAKVKEQIEAAMKDIGDIPDDRRRRFFRSYFEGRRAIEEQLRKEGDDRRTALTKELHERLKKEFGPEATQQATQQATPPLEGQPK